MHPSLAYATPAPLAHLPHRHWWLRHVPPCLPGHSPAQRALVDAFSRSQGGHGVLARLIEFARSGDRLFAELGPMATRAAWHPALLCRIRNIVCRRPNKEVIRVHARRVVAGVADEVSRWNRAFVQLVGYPMGEARSVHALRCGDRELTIAGLVESTSPIPAPVRAAHVGLKPICDRRWLDVREVPVGVVPAQVPPPVPLGHASSGIVAGRDLCPTAAPALAKPCGDFAGDFLQKYAPARVFEKPFATRANLANLCIIGKSGFAHFGRGLVWRCG